MKASTGPRKPLDSSVMTQCLGIEPQKIAPPTKVLDDEDNKAIQKKKVVQQLYQQDYKAKEASKQHNIAKLNQEKALHKAAIEKDISLQKTKEEEEAAKYKAMKGTYANELAAQREKDRIAKENTKKTVLKEKPETFELSGTRQYNEKMNKIKSKDDPNIIEIPKMLPNGESILTKIDQTPKPIERHLSPEEIEIRDKSKKIQKENIHLTNQKVEKEQNARKEEQQRYQQEREKALKKVSYLLGSIREREENKATR
jgi:hypothetical protein